MRNLHTQNYHSDHWTLIVLYMDIDAGSDTISDQAFAATLGQFLGSSRAGGAGLRKRKLDGTRDHPQGEHTATAGQQNSGGDQQNAANSLVSGPLSVDHQPRVKRARTESNNESAKEDDDDVEMTPEPSASTSPQRADSKNEVHRNSFRDTSVHTPEQSKETSLSSEFRLPPASVLPPAVRSRILEVLSKHKILSKSGDVQPIMFGPLIGCFNMRLFDMQCVSVQRLEEILRECNIFVSDVTIRNERLLPETTILFSLEPPTHRHCTDMVTRMPARMMMGEKYKIPVRKFTDVAEGNSLLLSQYRTAMSAVHGSKSNEVEDELENILLGNVLHSMMGALRQQSMATAAAATTRSDKKEEDLEINLSFDDSRGAFRMGFRLLDGHSVRLYRLRQVHDLQPYHVRAIEINNNMTTQKIDVFVSPFSRPDIDHAFLTGWNWI